MLKGLSSHLAGSLHVLPAALNFRAVHREGPVQGQSYGGVHEAFSLFRIPLANGQAVTRSRSKGSRFSVRQSIPSLPSL